MNTSTLKTVSRKMWIYESFALYRDTIPSLSFFSLRGRENIILFSVFQDTEWNGLKDGNYVQWTEACRSWLKDNKRMTTWKCEVSRLERREDLSELYTPLLRRSVVIGSFAKLFVAFLESSSQVDSYSILFFRCALKILANDSIRWQFSLDNLSK